MISPRLNFDLVLKLISSSQSRPPQDYWKITMTPDSNCIDQTWSLLVAGVVNALTDLIAVLLPIRTVLDFAIASPPNSHCHSPI